MTGSSVLTFSATGSVNYSGGTPTDPPNGTEPGGRGSENGISGFVTNWNALVGVFLSGTQPDSSPAPETLDFSGGGNVPGGMDYTTLSPALQQLFFIGGGVTSSGSSHQIVVPAGATRLFLGTTDGAGWYNNSGSFDVRIASNGTLEQAQLSISYGLTSTSDTNAGLVTHIGDDLTYTFTWVNSGSVTSATAINLQVETPVPTYLDATSGMSIQFAQTDLTFNQYGTYIPPTGAGANAAVRWNVANLNPGYEQSVSLKVHVGSQVKVGQTLSLPNNYAVYSTTSQPPGVATGLSSGSPGVGSTVYAAITIPTPVLTTIMPGTGNKPWTFQVIEQAPAGTTLQLQYSANGSDWSNLPSTEKLAVHGITLTAANVPNDAAFFRVVAQGSGGQGSSEPSDYKSLFTIDATIAEVTGTDPVKTGSALGKGIVNIESKQTLRLQANRDTSVIFAIHVDNNSRFPDAIRFAGGQDSSFFTAQYFAQGGTAKHPTIGSEITQAVVSGNFQPQFPSGAGFTVYLKVSVSELAPKNWSGGFSMEMTSAADIAVSDFVEAVVEVTEPKHTVYVRNTNDSGADTLRAAITYADANKGTTIKFAIPMSDPGFVDVSGGKQFVITPATLLPPITGHGTFLDGSSQQDATGSTNTAGPQVAIVGPGVDQSTQQNGFLYGLAVGSSECVIKGLAIEKCFAGIGLAGSKVTGNSILGCQFIGNANSGVAITYRAHGNTIGGPGPGDGNTFLPLRGESAGTGILIDGNGADGNFVYGNIIGNLNAQAGQNSISLFSGVQISGGAQDNYIGGFAPGLGNVISGNLIFTLSVLQPVGFGVWIKDAGTDSNSVLGNRIGTAADGNSAVANLIGVAVSDGASDNNIGSFIPGGGNTISGNFFEGVSIANGATSGNVVAGNYIGTNPVGNGAIGNGSSGVLISYATGGNTIGGKTEGSRNIISGNQVEGIRINSSNGNVIQGNLIGTAFDGASPIANGASGSYNGIVLDIASQNSVTDNTIAFNTGNGIQVLDGIGNEFRQNSIFSNVNLGIDLAGGVEDSYGVTANHTGNSVTGPNELQNYPILTNAYVSGNKTFVLGSINSTSKTLLYIDFYVNLAPDPSGHGQGQSFIGSGTVKTDANGNASFNFSFPKTYAGGYVTSTLTRKTSGSTSEFSNAFLVAPHP